MLTLESFVNKKQDGTYEISTFGWEYIMKLSSTVVYRYFKYRDTEDLISLATLDLAGFIINVLVGSDDEPRNLRNVLFTRARNVCTNSINHVNKSEPTEDETLAKNQSNYNADDYDIDLEYKFSTRAEAHELSLRIWNLYNGK